MIEAIEKIYAWTAKRAGGSMTLYGKTPEGEFRRVTGVEQIAIEIIDGLPAVVAVDKRSTRYLLATRHV